VDVKKAGEKRKSNERPKKRFFQENVRTAAGEDTLVVGVKQTPISYEAEQTNKFREYEQNEDGNPMIGKKSQMLAKERGVDQFPLKSI